MGAGASADRARSTMSTMLSDKPADASDITVWKHYIEPSFILFNLILSYYFIGFRTSKIRNC